MSGMISCESCLYYTYDEDYGDYYCTFNMDEDDYARLMQNPQARCQFWRDGDEYQVVKHQI